MVIKEGVSCDTCARQGMKNYCIPCSKLIGHQRWEAAEGVETEELSQISWRGNRPIYNTVIRIKKSAV